jgi:hypothetical protein
MSSGLDEVSLKIGRLEARASAQEANMSEMKDDMLEVKNDIKTLLGIANQGRGAWVAILKAGGLIILVLSGLAWLTEKAMALFQHH